MATAVLEQTWLGEEPIHVTWEMVAEVLRVMLSAAPASPRATIEDLKAVLRRIGPLLSADAVDRIADETLERIALPASPRAEGFVCGNCGEKAEIEWKHCAWCGSTPDWLPTPPAIVAEKGTQP